MSYFLFYLLNLLYQVGPLAGYYMDEPQSESCSMSGLVGLVLCRAHWNKSLAAWTEVYGNRVSGIVRSTGGEGVVGGRREAMQSRWTLQWVLSLLWKLVSDFAALTGRELLPPSLFWLVSPVVISHLSPYWSVLSSYHISYWSVLSSYHISLLIGQSSVIISHLSPYWSLLHQRHRKTTQSAVSLLIGQSSIRETQRKTTQSDVSLLIGQSSIREKQPISISNLFSPSLAMISSVFQRSKSATLSWIYIYSIHHWCIV